MRIAIVWGSTQGSTESAAEALREQLGGLVVAVHNVVDVSAAQMHEYDVLLLGASTWDIGELQYDWADRLPDLEELDWTGRYVAFFGCGDAVGYADTFVDVFGILWEVLGESGANLLGTWPVEGCEFTASRSLCENDTKFIGLPIDDDNDPELTDDRIAAWATQLKEELSALSVDAVG